MRIATYQPRSILPDVRALARKDYDHALQEFVERFRQAFQGSADFYQFGTVRTLGVSDIDLLIVVEDQKWARAIETASAAVSSSNELPTFFVHPPLVVCRSILKHLAFFHTLENCVWIAGDRDPIGELESISLSPADRFLRHAVWSSFMRVAALEMDGTEIGLRRSLILLHNLLLAAVGGNELLLEKVPLNLRTEAMRAEVLAAAPAQQIPLVRKYIEHVVSLLNEVDRRLDQESGAQGAGPKILASRNHFLLAPLDLRTDFAGVSRGLFGRLLKNTLVVPTPLYLVYASALIAGRTADWLPELGSFSKIEIPTGFRPTDVRGYVEHLRRAVAIFQSHQVPYFFVLPFSYRPPPTGPKDRLKGWLKGIALHMQAGN